MGKPGPQDQKRLPRQHPELGDLVALDGSLVNSVLPMHRAEYQTPVSAGHC